MGKDQDRKQPDVAPDEAKACEDLRGLKPGEDLTRLITQYYSDELSWDEYKRVRKILRECADEVDAWPIPTEEANMSILDKVVAAVTPPETEEQRREARAKAQAAAGSDDWLAMILEQHVQIEGAFIALKAARDMPTRLAAHKELAALLTGHANAEEAVIYPALLHFGHKSHAMSGYTEQAGAKANLGELEYLDPLSQDYLDKLEHLRGAVAHHMYEEENDRFLDLKQLSVADQDRLTRRFMEEFERYIGSQDQAGGGVGEVALGDAGVSVPH